MPDSDRRTAAAALLLALCTLAAPAGAQDEGAPPLTPCTTTYALCTSAPCLPVPGGLEITVDDETGAAAVCECDIVFGANVGLSECEDRRTTLLSTYSYAQAGALALLTCESDDAPTFANCLDAPCDIDPREPTRALCTCPMVSVMTSEPESAPVPWVTFGGGCDPEACGAVVWSGATTGDIAAANCVLNEYLHLRIRELDGGGCDGPYSACEPPAGRP